MKKQVLSILLTMAMILGLVMAVPTNTKASSNNFKNINLKITSTKRLTKGATAGDPSEYFKVEGTDSSGHTDFYINTYNSSSYWNSVSGASRTNLNGQTINNNSLDCRLLIRSNSATDEDDFILDNIKSVTVNGKSIAKNNSGTAGTYGYSIGSLGVNIVIDFQLVYMNLDSCDASTPSGYYVVGESAKVTAPEKANAHFTQWSGAYGVMKENYAITSFADENATTTTFVVPGNKGTVTPEYEEYTPVILAAKKATNTTSGLTEGIVCSECGKVLVAQETIPVISKVTLYKGVNKTYTLTSGEKASWSIKSGSKYASLKGTKLTVKKVGTVKVYDKNSKSYVKVYIKNPSISTSTKVSVKKGKTLQLKATATPEATVKYSVVASKYKKYATVTSAGKVTGKKKGTCYIYAKANGVKKKIKVSVK